MKPVDQRSDPSGRAAVGDHELEIGLLGQDALDGALKMQLVVTGRQNDGRARKPCPSMRHSESSPRSATKSIASYHPSGIRNAPSRAHARGVQTIFKWTSNMGPRPARRWGWTMFDRRGVRSRPPPFGTPGRAGARARRRYPPQSPIGKTGDVSRRNDGTRRPIVKLEKLKAVFRRDYGPCFPRRDIE